MKVLVSVCCLSLAIICVSAASVSTKIQRRPFKEDPLKFKEDPLKFKEDPSDLITDLPGLDGITPNFRQYSGYLDAGNGIMLHYW